VLMRVFEANGMVGWVILICIRNCDRSQESLGLRNAGTMFVNNGNACS
jgi:hypothetical protein